MACSKPMFQGQCPILCQFCDIDPNIQWRCEDCNLLLCTNCKDKIHSKVKTTKEHRIINTKEIGTKFKENSIHPPVKKAPTNLELCIEQTFSTKFGVYFMQVALDDSLWIGSADIKKFFSFKSSRHLQKVNFEMDKLNLLSSFNVDVYDIAITPSNNLIITDSTPNLKQILHNSKKVIGSYCCVAPYDAIGVHVNRDNKIVVGAWSEEVYGALFVMDMNGIHEKIYRFDKNNKQLFTLPFRITSVSSGTLFVIDIFSRDPPLGRIVMLEKGEVVSIYTGQTTINSDNNPFSPMGVVSTSSDNIIISDFENDTLHILNNRGQFLTYFNTRKIGIQNPSCISCTNAEYSSILYIASLVLKGKK